MPPGALGERRRLGREAADLALAARSRGAVRIGARLDQLGFPEEADRLYDAASRRFLEQGGNVDLSFAPGDAHILRRTGGELFQRGDIARALALVETSRRFTSYLDGDTLFTLATGERPSPDLPGLFDLMAAAGDCVTRAVGHAMLAATSVVTPGGEIRSWRDAFPSATA